MDRKPLPPPFAKGTRVRYTGTRRVYITVGDGTEIPLVEPGMVVAIDETKPGRRGTMKPLPGDYDEDWQPYDQTVDGRSIFVIEGDGGRPYRRIIWPRNAYEWEQV